MKPRLPNNAYELIAIRDEMKAYLNNLEKVEPDERGFVKFDPSSMITLRSKLRDGITMTENLLYFMRFENE